MQVKYYDFESMHRPLKARMIEKFGQIYDSGGFILGENVDGFEKQFAAFCGARHCVGVASGLDALIIALRTLNIGAGDEVIVPSNTFIASWLAVSAVGATPVPVEPKLATCNIDPEKIEAAVTVRTKAIMPVHLYGQACEMRAIMRIASKHNLFIVEDNAQAQGAKYGGVPTGSFGTINATSFYPAKNLGALGDAGAITTDNQALAERAAIIRNYGSKKKYINDELGLNSRMDELQAAFLLLKLEYLNNWNNERKQIAMKYVQRLTGIGDIILPELANEAESVYHLYVIRTRQRDGLTGFLTENNIGNMIHYPVPPHLQNAYAGYNYKRGDFPIAEEIASTCLSLPIYPGLKNDHIDYIAEKIRQFYQASISN